MEIDNVVTVAGAKGGVGKTTTSINVGATAAANGLRTAVVELDLAMANLRDFLSLPSADDDPTLHDVLAGEASTEDAVYYVEDGFAVAPSGTDLDGYTDVDFERLPDVVETLQSSFDLVVVDTGAGLSRATVEPVRLADTVMLVSTPRVAAIRDVEKTKQIAERLGTPVSGLVLTKSGTGSSPGPDRIAEFLDVRLLGHVPNDEAVPTSQDQGVPVTEAKPDSTATEKYQKVTGNLLFKLDTGIQDDSTGMDGSGPLSAEQLSLVSDAVSVDPQPAVREALQPEAEATESESADEESPAPDRATDGSTRPTAATDGRGPFPAIQRAEDGEQSDIGPSQPTVAAEADGGDSRTERSEASTTPTTDAIEGTETDPATSGDESGDGADVVTENESVDTDAASGEDTAAVGTQSDEDGDGGTESSMLSQVRSRLGF